MGGLIDVPFEIEKPDKGVKNWPSSKTTWKKATLKNHRQKDALLLPRGQPKMSVFHLANRGISKNGWWLIDVPSKIEKPDKDAQNYHVLSQSESHHVQSQADGEFAWRFRTMNFV
jgi:hypothetical protein